ncbi:MAG: restriction endonuclease [Halopseudomonas sp.]
MSPEFRAWMHPDDLVLYQLDLLPWPAYTRLVERFFEENDYRTRLIASEAGRTEFLLIAKTGVRYILHCCSVKAASDRGELDRLRRNMNRFQVEAGLLATPRDFGVTLISAARGLPVELYSGNRLRAKIEMLAAERRRAVMDSIRPTPEPDRG